VSACDRYLPPIRGRLLEISFLSFCFCLPLVLILSIFILMLRRAPRPHCYLLLYRVIIPSSAANRSRALFSARDSATPARLRGFTFNFFTSGCTLHSPHALRTAARIMDPLTIPTSILGLLKATAQVAQYLAPYVAAVRDTPKIVTQVHSEVSHSRTILLALEALTKNLASIPVRRAALIQVDELIAVFTDGVLLFSELEASLPSQPPTEPTSPRIPFQTRLQWARKESTFAALLTRLQGFKGSISLMLTILQRQAYPMECH
jgi:hypothetical protein